MNRLWRRIISVVLCFCICLNLVPVGLAVGTEEASESYFDFEASEYEAKENQDELKVKIVRHGEGDAAATVAIKAADFLSTYGEDYVILDDKGEQFEKVEGEKPDVSDFVYDEGDEETGVDTEDEIEVETVNGKLNIPSLPVYTEKKTVSTGSNLLDAQNQYLGITEIDNSEAVESSSEETLEDMYNYLTSAAGAAGFVSFKKGETEKTITVKLLNNETADESRLFMLALMGTDNELTSIAANATTYVSIIDDEENENSVFDIAESSITLTESDPTAEITITRTGGTQYFATVYVSTVNETAAVGAYDEFEDQVVAFIPGETEKNVTVKANSFSKDAKFGVRLERDDEGDVGNYYCKVIISASEDKDSAVTQLLSTESMTDSEAVLLADETGTVLGQAEVKYESGYNELFTQRHNGDGRTEILNDSRLIVKQYDKNCFTMYTTTSKFNLVGVNKIRYYSYTTNTSRGFDTKYQSYNTWFETSADLEFAGSLNANRVTGNSNWQERDLMITNGDSGFIQFAVYPTSGGYDNPEAQLDWFSVNYSKYTFSPQDSTETFSRYVYDFTEGTPKIYQTYFDGETKKLYNPGSVVIQSSGSNVSGFYTSNTSNITITAANEAVNAERGLILKGVYFVKSSVETDKFYTKNGGYKTSEVYYVAAKNGTVTVCPNATFLKTLQTNGVVTDIHSDATIKVYPVFEQEMVPLRFLNADTDGEYTEANKGSFIRNVLEAKLDSFTEDGVTYYAMAVEKCSVIVVEEQTISTKTPNGILADHWYEGTKVEYIKKGDKLFNGSDPNGTTATETNTAKAQIVNTLGLNITPNTIDQSFDVNYLPIKDAKTGELKYIIPDAYKGSDGLKNAVVVTDTITTDNTVGTDSKGSYSIVDAYTGMKFDFTAIAPEGYYTQWVNMTGDTNGDGIISVEESIATRKNGSTPDDIYGNRITGILDQDNLILDYIFLPMVDSGESYIAGQVVRSAKTFYDIANNVQNSSVSPVVGAYINVSGVSCLTDADGNYSMSIKNLPIAGNVSTYIIADGYEYNAITKLRRPTTIQLESLTKFTPISISIGYASNTSAINGTMVSVNNETLNITAKVTSYTSMIPTNARFFIYDKDGYLKKELDGADGYTVTRSNINNDLSVTLSFNPKKDMTTGDKIYVQFCDQNGEWTNEINLGYTFMSKLSFADFVFPLIGSSTLENVITTGAVADIIGNPLGDLSVGSIGLTENSYSYTPSAVSLSDAQNFTWLRTTYSAGWSGGLWSGAKDVGGNNTPTQEQIRQAAETEGQSVESKYKTKGRFSWNLSAKVGFKLTLSTRSDAKNYFEDLYFFVGVNISSTSSVTITLPIGLNIIIELGLGGNITGVYRMFTDYEDLYETEDAALFNTEEFGMFKSFNNNVRREGYLFIDPYIYCNLSLNFGILYVWGRASFNFDMDFKFATGKDYAYGDMKFTLDWGVKLFSFDVYSSTIADPEAVELFSKNANSHFTTNYASTMLNAVTSSFADSENDTLVLDKVSSRAYLTNRSEWYSKNKTTLLSSGTSSKAAATGTSFEKRLMSGVNDNPEIKTLNLPNGEIFMVYIDDDPERNDVNRRALYYSIYSKGKWTIPEILENDGTLDGYPNLCDLGNGTVFISWSSADRVLPDDATLEDTLKTINIKCALFYSDTHTFSEVEEVTQTTEGDYCADLLSHAAYDEETGRFILYYTKTEYEGLDDLTSLSTAVSVNAYMLYQNGRWCDASDYTEEELEGVEDVDQYKKDWYGQRFLDIRLNKSEASNAIIVESDSISYNGLALYTWVTDWDKDLTTTDDRDVFLQIYDFAEDSFTHIMRVTTDTASYSNPSLVRNDNKVYLFYGELQKGEDGELATQGTIKYLPISQLIKDSCYTKVVDGDTEYYVFKYEREEYELVDNVEKLVKNTIVVEPETIAETDNPANFCITVSENDKAYLVWTKSEGSTRQIVAVNAMLNSHDETDAEDATDFYSKTVSNKAIQVSDADEDMYYSGISATVYDDSLFVLAAKCNYEDESDSSLIWINHVPFANAVITDVALSNEIPLPCTSVDITATVYNEGLKILNASEKEPVTVHFEFEGEEIGKAYITEPISGGTSVTTNITIDVPENFDEYSEAEITAYIEKDSTVSTKVYVKSVLNIVDGAIEYSDTTVFKAYLSNTGNKNAKDVVVTAKVGDTVVGTTTIASLPRSYTENLAVELNVPEELLDINEQGVGNAEVTITAVEGKEELASVEVTYQKQYDSDAINLIEKVTEIKACKNYYIKPGEKQEIQPTLVGDNDDMLTVQWVSTSDENVVYVNYDNEVVALNKGTATLTGIVVPAEERIIIENEEAERVDWSTIIPADKLKTVTVNVNVTEEDVLPFEDVQITDWFYEAVRYSYYNGIFKGVTETTFAPKSLLTRAMFVTVLWRMENEPESDAELQFTDIANNAYYIEALKWAYENEIINGVSENTFAPNANITREQIATIIYRYAKYKGDDTEVNLALTYNDKDSISSWATDAVRFCKATGIMEGDNNNMFNPKAGTKRSEAAAIAQRILTKWKEN